MCGQGAEGGHRGTSGERRGDIKGQQWHRGRAEGRRVASGWPVGPLPVNPGPTGAVPHPQRASAHLQGAGAAPHREATSRDVVLSLGLLCTLARLRAHVSLSPLSRGSHHTRDPNGTLCKVRSNEARASALPSPS